MTTTQQVRLAEYTTLRLGGPAARFVAPPTEEDLIAAVAAADREGDPVLVLGGGSNLVVADAGFEGAVVRVASAGAQFAASDGSVEVAAAAGQDWDELVRQCLAEGLSGIECLSGIPGSVGATPIQNVGAYGQEVAETITAVRAYDRQAGQTVRLGPDDLDFGYRTSMFKHTGWPVAGRGPEAGPTGRHVVLDVTFALERDPMSVPIGYSELARALGVGLGDRAPLADVRSAVLELRRGKGMVLDPGDPDTVSAGSFFTNPVLDPGQFAALERTAAARFPGERVPVFPAGHERVKVPAAWLIERAGFGKGYPGYGPARISSKHTLALTNAGGASTRDLIELARQIAGGVRSEFGIELAHEPVLVGVTL